MGVVQRPPATPKAAAASLLSAAQREQRHAALAVTLQDAEADLCPGILLQQATGAQWQLGAASAIALLNAEAGLCPDTQQQRWHCAPAAAAPLGAEAGLCMAMLLKQGTILQLQPGAPPPAQAPQLGTVQRIALQTLQRLAAQGNASPVQESGSAAMLQVQTRSHTLLGWDVFLSAWVHSCSIASPWGGSAQFLRCNGL